MVFSYFLTHRFRFSFLRFHVGGKTQKIDNNTSTIAIMLPKDVNPHFVIINNIPIVKVMYDKKIRFQSSNFVSFFFFVAVYNVIFIYPYTTRLTTLITI